MARSFPATVALPRCWWQAAISVGSSTARSLGSEKYLHRRRKPSSQAPQNNNLTFLYLWKGGGRFYDWCGPWLRDSWCKQETRARVV